MLFRSKGTGLGLALVHNIIEEHYGHISISSPVPEHIEDLQRSLSLDNTLPAKDSISANNAGACVTLRLPKVQNNLLEDDSE